MGTHGYNDSHNVHSVQQDKAPTSADIKIKLTERLTKQALKSSMLKKKSSVFATWDRNSKKPSLMWPFCSVGPKSLQLLLPKMKI
jgi:hypothetical protein